MGNKRSGLFWKNPLFSRLYYMLKPFVPRSFQILGRRYFYRRALPRVASVWPIDHSTAAPPEGWKGWPENKRFALVLTHDVESRKGVDRCRSLAELEMELGFRSSFNFLVRKYVTPEELRIFLESNCFEVGVHGCDHDGKKFDSREIFLERAAILNRYLEDWDSCGFRAPAMQCNLEWIGDLDIEYDLSTFDTDPFETQDGGAGSIFPYLVPRSKGKSGFVELPYTLPQDSTLFIMLGEKNIDIWKRKLDWIAEKGGMALVNVHPDYTVYNGKRPSVDEYPVKLYEDLLRYISERYKDQYYHCLPRELARYFLEGQNSAEKKERGDI